MTSAIYSPTLLTLENFEKFACRLAKYCTVDHDSRLPLICWEPVAGVLQPPATVVSIPWLITWKLRNDRWWLQPATAEHLAVVGAFFHPPLELPQNSCGGSQAMPATKVVPLIKPFPSRGMAYVGFWCLLHIRKKRFSYMEKKFTHLPNLKGQKNDSYIPYIKINLTNSTSHEFYNLVPYLPHAFLPLFNFVCVGLYIYTLLFGHTCLHYLFSSLIAYSDIIMQFLRYQAPSSVSRLSYLQHFLCHETSWDIRGNWPPHVLRLGSWFQALNRFSKPYGRRSFTSFNLSKNGSQIYRGAKC